MLKQAVITGALALALSGCIWSGGALNVVPREKWNANLVSALVPASSGGTAPPTTLETLWTWTPTAKDSLVIYLTCVGYGFDRACSMGFARVKDDTVEKRIRVERVGWGLPELNETAQRVELVMGADDGRGLWRQLVRFEPANSGIELSRRQYPDGL